MPRICSYADHLDQLAINETPMVGLLPRNDPELLEFILDMYEREELQRINDELKERKRVLEERLVELNARLKELEDLKARLEEERRRLEEDCEEMEARVEELQTELAEATERNAVLQSEVMDQENDLESEVSCLGFDMEDSPGSAE